MHGTISGETMGTASVKLVAERMFAARERGDIAALMSDVTDDVSYEVCGQIAGQPITPPVRGKSALTSYFEGLFERWVWDGISVRNVIASHDHAVVETAGQMLHSVSNQRFHMTHCTVLTFRNGKVASIREYCDTFTVVRIAGLAL